MSCSDAVQMRAGFGMDADMVGSRLGEGGEIGINRRDHQMHVERQAGVRPQGFQDGGPKVMLGTKCPSMMSRCSQSAPAASTAARFLARDARNPRRAGWGRW